MIAAMVGHRALTIALAALALACGAVTLLAAAPARFVPVAAAHPEPNDVDGDEVANADDNCPTTPNGSQLNTDGDTEGDSCDADDDNDGFPDSADNCRLVPNDQTDSNRDGRGDACPFVDTDLDGVFEADNCPAIANPDQRDLDGDDRGDVCDRDDDGDKYDDGFDNCPTTYNPDQADLDKDGLGSGCDAQELIAGPATGGGPTAPGEPPAGGPSGQAASDTRAPVVSVSIARRQRLSDAGRSLVVTVRCSEACSLSAELSAGAAAARRAGLGRTRGVLARGSWSLAGAGRTYVFARWTSTVRKLRPGRRLKATLRLTATDPAGNRRVVSRSIELRR
ncbi:MAG: hypothetical protein AVDCRST_MAG67-895 [uncultured Solirubrobacteraceae bacterium]|uniref:Uncharacterized protein n=1 Tax=uncultured Solirubrobacteraceae bacterium TaxID=1162706 RepID=A0A6J4S001_9ACTN|nr:MAG: hypothetical protein AVDCRST_MAG67-895 [uncultured Solirubrobacteraceae bacterium]